MSLAAPTARLRGSGAVTRAALVDALAGVAGLVAYPSAPEQATAGAAWPKWIQTTFTGHLTEAGRDAWDIYAVLPADYAPATIDEGDTLRDLVAPVLIRLGPVQYAEPVMIAFQDNQAMPGIRLRMTTDR